MWLFCLLFVENLLAFIFCFVFEQSKIKYVSRVKVKPELAQYFSLWLP